MALKKVAPTLLAELIQKQASQTSRDMRDWRNAKREATHAEFPRRTALIDMVRDMLYDTHLSSQMELRRDRSLSKPFALINAAGETEEELTELLSESVAFGELMRHIFETPYWGHTLLELTPAESDLFTVTLLPRRHVVPPLGLLLRDVSAREGIAYREDPRYGINILEIGDATELGILFDCVPDTIYKRHAKAAWSEFAELFGIPPRTLKMDTDDREALERAEQMMQQMGRANWAIIDSNEEMSFASGVAANGDIFDRLINAAKEDISLKICGCVVGQDTENGNRSKEESSMKLLDAKCAKDRAFAEKIMTSTILPAIAQLGHIPEGLRFRYPAEEDIDGLWQRTVSVLAHYDVDEEWLRNTFGIEVTGRKQLADPLMGAGAKLQAQQQTKLQAQLAADEQEQDPFFD